MHVRLIVVLINTCHDYRPFRCSLFNGHAIHMAAFFEWVSFDTCDGHSY